MTAVAKYSRSGLWLCVLFAVFVSSCSPDSNSQTEVQPGKTPEARSILKLFAEFQGRLKPELKAAIGAGGTAGAIERCHSISPELEALISREFAAEQGRSFQVRRVSDRPRNPAHAPDQYEAGVLAAWQADLQAGRKIDAVVRTTDAGLRVMQPIRTAGMCLACHGAPENIEAETRARLRKLYPQDRALGYETGDLRGAFSAVLGP